VRRSEPFKSAPKPAIVGGMKQATYQERLTRPPPTGLFFDGP